MTVKYCVCVQMYLFVCIIVQQSQRSENAYAYISNTNLDREDRHKKKGMVMSKQRGYLGLNIIFICEKGLSDYGTELKGYYRDLGPVLEGGSSENSEVVDNFILTNPVHVQLPWQQTM